MKRFLSVLIGLLAMVAAVSAQPVFGSRHDRFGSHYRQRRHPGGYSSWYCGLLVGATASHVTSDSDELSGNRLKTGWSLGAAAGFNLAPAILVESGLYYAEKGGTSRNDDGRFSYELDYLEVPLMLKYNRYTASGVVLQPFVGAYLAMGVGGKIRDYRERESFSSFGPSYFRHGDSGVKIGIGATYSVLHASIGYDFGLANIGRDEFSDTRNRALRLNVGFAF